MRFLIKMGNRIKNYSKKISRKIIKDVKEWKVNLETVQNIENEWKVTWIKNNAKRKISKIGKNEIKKVKKKVK